MNARQAPILITGFPRSGTTFVGRVLGAEPSIFYLHEPFANHCRAGFFRWAHEEFFPCLQGDEPALEEKLRALLRLEFNLREDWRGHQASVARVRAVGWWLRAAWARWQRARPLIKDPGAVLSIDWMQARFGFRTVVMVRDPVAVVRSFLRMGWKFDLSTLRQLAAVKGIPFDPERFAPLSDAGQVAVAWDWVHTALLAEKAWHPEWVFVTHEDLVANPVAEMEKIYDSLNVPFRPGSRQRVQDLTGPHNPTFDPDDRMSVRRDARRLNAIDLGELSTDDCLLIRRITNDTAAAFYPNGTEGGKRG